MRAVTRCVFAAMLLLGAGTTNADSWLPPMPETFVSADGQARVTITPRPIGGALPYFEDKVAGKEPAGQRPDNGQRSPVAALERRQDGKWRQVWKLPLVNDVGPVNALVANGGRYLVTFDNWHSAGYGPDAVVIYDGEGRLVRKFALEDFLPEAYVAQLPRSVSSLWWGGDHALANDDETLLLHVVEPTEENESSDRPRTVPLRIRLADGQVLPPAGAEWERAMAVVNALDAKRQERWRQARELRATPLPTPDGGNADAWRDYLAELRDRLSDSTGHPHAGLVLPAAGAGGDADSITEMLDGFVEFRELYGDHFVFVSPSSPRLAELLGGHLAAMQPGSMRGARIAFVGSQEDGEKVNAAAAGSGAEILLIDKSVPFPPGSLPQAPPEWFR